MFDADAYDWQNDLKVALEDIRTKTPNIDLCWRYYDGPHPRLWLTDDIKDEFERDDLNLNNEENWIDVAVDAPLQRLGIEGWEANDVSDETQQQTTVIKAVENVWSDNDMELEQIELYRACRVAGEGYIFAHKDEDKDSGIDLTVNDARLVHWPENSDRTNPHHVVKVWMSTEEKCWRATIWYRYVAVRLIGPKFSGTNAVLPSGPRYFTVDPDEPGGPHDFDRPPVIRFSLRKKRQSLVERLIPTQNRLNALEKFKMVAAEWSAYRRLALLTEQIVDDDTARMRPNRLAVFDPGGGADGAAPTSIWEGSATELANFDDSIEKERDKLFTKATLPSHMAVTKGKVAPSGAEREADEGPFVESIKGMHRLWGASWDDLWMLLFGVHVKPIWTNPQIKSDKDEMDTVKTGVDAGVSKGGMLKKYAGWTDEEIKAEEEADTNKQNKAMAIAQAQGVNNESTDESRAEQPGQVTSTANNIRSGPTTRGI